VPFENVRTERRVYRMGWGGTFAEKSNVRTRALKSIKISKRNGRSATGDR